MKLLPASRMLPVVLMGTLAALTFWLERTVRVEESAPTARRHDPDYSLTNFTTTTYDRDGEVQSILSAVKMIHYPDDDSTELIRPRVVQMRPDEPRMTVSAERGALSREGDEIFLYDNVLLVREADETRPQARLTTSFLHVLRDRSIIRTDREVHLVEERRSLRGRGMVYNSETKQLELMAQVRGVFEPKKSP